MKKTLLFIITLISIFAFTKVSAEGPFYYDWDTGTFQNTMPYDHVSYKDGYITVDQKRNTDALTIYDKSGEILVKKDFNYYLDKIIIDGDNIYLLGYNISTHKNCVMLLDDKLTIKEEINGDFDDFKMIDDKIAVLVYKDNKSYTYYYTKDLSSHTEEDFQESDWYPTDFEAAYDYVEANYSMNNFVMNYTSQDIKDDLIAGVFTIMNPECSGILGYTESHITYSPKPMLAGELICTTPYVVLINNKGIPKWEKELTGYLAASQVAFVENYIAVIALKETSSDILIFDMDGNIVQTFTSTNGFVKVTETNQGFAVSEGICYPWDMYIDKTLLPDEPFLPGTLGNIGNNNGNIRLLEQSDPNGRMTLEDFIDTLPFDVYFQIGCSCYDQYHNYGLPGTKNKQMKPLALEELSEPVSCKTDHQMYYLFRDITPKITEGKGNIEVASHGKPGEPVTFTVTPEEGYTLGIIKVTTADGEVLTFTDYTFTMPTADVTIEATFIAANPKTADIALISIALVTAIALGMFIYQKRRLKELK